jgi:NAD(P)H-hydrate epimerase
MLDSFKDIAKRQEETHKGNYGRVLVVAGSLGMSGAAYLCSQAAMISGCGLCELALPKSINSILETKTTEVITYPQEETREGTFNVKAFDSIMQLSQKANVVAIGCGLKNNAQIKSLIKKLIKNLDAPLVLDADALNSIADDIFLLKEVKKDIIVTPHPGEMARLIKSDINTVQSERIKLAKRFSLKYNVITVLKGHQTVVVDKLGDKYVNTTGNPGMATAGSGDVLTGMIASFVAQGLKPFGAAKLGVYLHGLSGDIAASKKGQVSLIASDILECVPEAIRKI